MLPSDQNSTTTRGSALRAALFASALLAVAACHDSDDGAPVEAARPDNPSRALETGAELPGIRLVILEFRGSRADGILEVGDRPTVRFTAKTAGGAHLDVGELDSGSIFVSGPTNNYQRVIAEQADLRARAFYEGDGVWSYRFASPIPSTYLAPLNDSPAFTSDELTGQPLRNGTYTVGLAFAATYTDPAAREFVDAGNATADFLLGTSGAVAPRAVVQSGNCNVCHTGLRAHGERFRDVGTCLLCHTAGAEDDNTAGATPGVTIEFKVMMHKIHNGSHLPSVLGVSTDERGDRSYPGYANAVPPRPLVYARADGTLADYSGATFPVWPNFNIAMPRDRGYSALSSTDPDGSGPLLSPRSCEDTIRRGVTACAKCHGDPDAGGPLTAPSQGNLAYAQTTRRTCGSCHDDVDWDRPYAANGLPMFAQPDDSLCILCHTNSAANQPSASYEPISVVEAHVHPLNDPAIDAGVVSAITAVGGGTGAMGQHQIGDPVTLTFTLKDDQGQDLGVAAMDSCSAFFFGPTQNQQLILPPTSPGSATVNPFDFAGRFVATSTTNKGTMGKVRLGGTAVQEVLTVGFTSATAFTVTGSLSGALASGTLAASASTNPSGSSVSVVEVGPGIAAGAVQIVFGDATNFTVSGVASGSGALPASLNGSTRFQSDVLSFNIASGTTAFAAGNTIHLAIVEAGAANPVKFALVVGRTAFAAGDRFYYEVVPDAASYTVNAPMDLVYEFLGDSSAAPGQVLPPAGNLPVYFGRQSLFEAANSTTVTTTTAAAAARLGRTVAVNPSTGWANNDVVVIEPTGGLGVREYVAIAPFKADGAVATSTDTTTSIAFKTPLRYAHNAGATVTKVTLTLKLEGAGGHYTLDPTSGVITSTGAFTASRGLVLSYRSHARFGYKRHSGDAFQAYYVPPINDSADLGQEQGEWAGLPYLDGTYTADLWFFENLPLGLHNEVQTYRSTSSAATADFLFGNATTIEPRQVISSSANCYTCHNDVLFHGGGRRGVDSCLTCHNVAGAEDRPLYDSSTAAATPGATIEFRQIMHEIHEGAAGEPVFPAMPGGVQQCVRCHGNDVWQSPPARAHGAATRPTKTWTIVCGSCHDSAGAQTHIAAGTAASGYESCSVCHDVGREYAVEPAHFVR